MKIYGHGQRLPIISKRIKWKRDEKKDQLKITNAIDDRIDDDEKNYHPFYGIPNHPLQCIAI